METERFVVAAKDDGVGESVARNTNHISIVVFVGRKLREDIGLWNTDAQTYRLALMTGRVFLRYRPVGTPAAAQAFLVAELRRVHDALQVQAVEPVGNDADVVLREAGDAFLEVVGKPEVTVDDAKVAEAEVEVRSGRIVSATVKDASAYADKTMALTIKAKIKDDVTVKVLIGALKVSTRIEGFGDNFDVKKDLSAFGHFTLKREETEDDDSTPDVDESIVYENQFQIKKGDNNIVFDAEIPDPPAANTIYRDPLPKGTYKLKMDIDMLTGYEVGAEVWVDGEKIADIRRGDVKIVNGKEYSFDGIYIMIDPKIEGGKWVYPEVEYVLKAYRELNPLKDLT